MGAKYSCQQTNMGFIELKCIFINTEYITYIEIENDENYVKINFMGNPYPLVLHKLNDREMQILQTFLSDRLIPPSLFKLWEEHLAISEIDLIS